MNPKIVERPAFTMLGYRYQGKNEHQEIAAMWEQFLSRMGEIHTTNPLESFGVCRMVPGLPPGEFEYIAGLEVDDDHPVPEGMVKLTLPAARYAVLEHRGGLETLQDTFHKIAVEYLPNSGLTRVTPEVDIEVYDDRVFRGFSPESILYIYVAVQ
ncbi:GyrI-like domain-containing protein [Anaerolinea sp.]|uniref:GyrI-like domain-containing protein n=1 Tax=Anaerolinea sp. TaxID=1872519 RepID=UPI002ACE533D|nr:GyrI-like domain-containing protein [Anaerolinea sp.]